MAIGGATKVEEHDKCSQLKDRPCSEDENGGQGDSEKEDEYKSGCKSLLSIKLLC